MDYPLQTVGSNKKEEPINGVSQVDVISDVNTRDRVALARLGKRQVLNRNFSFLSVAAFSCTVLVTWEGILELFADGLDNGGPAGLVYGYLITWIGTISIFTTISELASLAPVAGGQYHWVAMLAPTSCKRFLSYMIGWLTMLAWQTAITSAGFLSGTMIEGLLILNYPDTEFKSYQGILLGYACLLVALFFNTVVSSRLPSVESCILVIHVLGFFAIVIVIGYTAPHGSSADVFKTFLNGGGWSTQGVSLLVGLIGNVFSFTGADAAVHMAEEIHNASVVLPRAILGSLLLNGSMGFAVLLVMLFGIGDVDAVLSTPTGYPFIQIFVQATGSVGGSTAMASIIVLSVFFACLGFIATASRMVWSFARDRGLPFSSFLAKVDSRTSVPINAVLVTTMIGSLLFLIGFGSALALNIILSLAIFCWYSTYFTVCALLLWRRCQPGMIGPHIPLENVSDQGDIAGPRLVWGSFKVPGIWGIANNIFACGYILVVTFFSFWPAETKPSLKDMNWSAVISAGGVVFSIVYYLAWGKRFYKGPIIETY